MEGKVIVVFDPKEGVMDAYRDLTPLARELNVHRTTLRGLLLGGIQYIDNRFIGYATLHKSGRGGHRTKKQT